MRLRALTAGSMRCRVQLHEEGAWLHLNLWHTRSNALEAAHDFEPAEASACDNTARRCVVSSLYRASAGYSGRVCVGLTHRWQEGMLTVGSIIIKSLFRVAGVHLCLLHSTAGPPDVDFHLRHCEQVVWLRTAREAVD